MSQHSDAKLDYFEYLENVLGIKSILQSHEDLKGPAVITTDLLFCIQDYKNYSAEESDLLSKMIAAVKVDPSRLKVCDFDDAVKFETQCLVIFQNEVQNPPVKASLTVQTFSPRVLLKKPDLKKQAWTELQKILQHFS